MESSSLIFQVFDQLFHGDTGLTCLTDVGLSRAAAEVPSVVRVEDFRLLSGSLLSMMSTFI